MNTFLNRVKLFSSVSSLPYKKKYCYYLCNVPGANTGLYRDPDAEMKRTLCRVLKNYLFPPFYRSETMWQTKNYIERYIDIDDIDMELELNKS